MMLRRAKAGRKRSCLMNDIERDDDSKISHPALRADIPPVSIRIGRGRRFPMQGTPSWHIGAIVAGYLAMAFAADAQILRCRGDLVFEDNVARRVTLFV